VCTLSGFEFVSEAIKPVVADADATRAPTGGPSLPHEFVWRGKPLHVASVLRTWRDTGACRHGSGEAYVRKHWFEVQTVSGRKAQIYFERQARGRNRTRRWWLYCIERI